MARGGFEPALAFTLRWEGRWSDDARDPGGATMQGVTLATYSHWLGRTATKAELQRIPREHLTAIYRTRYWDAVKGDDLPAGLDAAVFDFAVNSGAARAAKHLQALVHVEMDGRIGPATLKAAESYVRRWGAAPAIRSYNQGRVDFLKRLATWKHFGKGWSNRVASLNDNVAPSTQDVGVERA